MEDFLYPIPDPYVWEQPEGQTGTRIGVHFEFEAQYKNDPVPCLCICCQFEQYVWAERTYTSRDPDSGELTPGDPKKEPLTEDCVWYYLEDVETLPGGLEALKPGAKTHRPTETPRPGAPIGWACYGDEGTQLPVDAAAPSTHSSSQCNYWGCDEPSDVSYPIRHFDASLTFVGLIRDMCNYPRIVRLDAFKITFGNGGAQRGAEPGRHPPRQRLPFARACDEAMEKHKKEHP